MLSEVTDIDSKLISTKFVNFLFKSLIIAIYGGATQ